jgi:hypothetical protein
MDKLYEGTNPPDNCPDENTVEPTEHSGPTFRPGTPDIVHKWEVVQDTSDSDYNEVKTHDMQKYGADYEPGPRIPHGHTLPYKANPTGPSTPPVFSYKED